jgi:formamidopyrimidine-DNA glycosylase
MGPEPLEEEFTLEKFKTMLKAKKTKIKPLLMDQAFIAGVGNLYAAEALFSAGIHPQRSTNTLKDEEIKSLFLNMKRILKEAIKYRGSSVDTYRDTSGKKGGFEERLKVYGRENQPCFKCKTPIKRITLGGRGTYFCPHCQK